ncbi:MAG TPA: SlyX family protein [Fibrobacteria bacterium]|nr:SlyX family protein [Fibrobacteria bacterium]
MDALLTDRILELEVKVAYQERTLDSLNEVILDLRSELETLRREFDVFRDETREADKPFGPANEPPPHY